MEIDQADDFGPLDRHDVSLERELNRVGGDIADDALHQIDGFFLLHDDQIAGRVFRQLGPNGRLAAESKFDAVDVFRRHIRAFRPTPA